MICIALCGAALGHVAVPHTSGCMPAIMDVPIVEGNVKRLIKCWSEKYLGVQQGLMNTIHEVEINYCPDTAKNTHTSKVTFLVYLIKRAETFFKRW